MDTFGDDPNNDDSTESSNFGEKNSNLRSSRDHPLEQDKVRHLETGVDLNADGLADISVREARRLAKKHTWSLESKFMEQNSKRGLASQVEKSHSYVNHSKSLADGKISSNNQAGHHFKQANRHLENSHHFKKANPSYDKGIFGNRNSSFDRQQNAVTSVEDSLVNLIGGIISAVSTAVFALFSLKTANLTGFALKKRLRLRKKKKKR